MRHPPGSTLLPYTTLFRSNLAGGIFDAQVNSQSFYWTAQGAQPVFNNAGTFRRSVGTGNGAVSSTTVNKTGTVDVQRGPLNISNQFNNDGTVVVHAGSLIA